MKLTAVVLTKNEEKNIENCLNSLVFCDEVIVVDDFSEDKTVEIVHKFDKNIKVVQRKLNNDFAGQRNFGLTKSRNEWVLFVDADEVV
ncbi:MAG: glycosyltransferase, partial [Candidatus Roizmanbacteria bacterium]|nr:glycosyltransferase [Candidatus Roizmanbacteria bacterium]